MPGNRKPLYGDRNTAVAFRIAAWRHCSWVSGAEALAAVGKRLTNKRESVARCTCGAGGTST